MKQSVSARKVLSVRNRTLQVPPEGSPAKFRV